MNKQKVLFLIIAFCFVLIVIPLKALYDNTNFTSDGNINATSAKHLNSDKKFISDIFAQIKNKDDIWSETISNDEFVKVTYQKDLMNENVIDVYVRGNGWIEIYDSKLNLVGTSKIFSSEEWEYILINNLSHATNTFYFKIKGSLQFDYIHDASSLTSVSLLVPSTTVNINTNTTFYMNCSFACTGSGTTWVNLSFNFNTSSTAWGRITPTAVLKNQSGTPSGIGLKISNCTSGDGVNFGLKVNATTAGTYNVRCKANSATDINSTLQQVVVTDSTCPYSGSGNWALNCADNCVFATTTTIANQDNVTITGTGALTFNNGGKWSFTGSNQYVFINSGCTLNINTGGGWNY